MKNWMIGTMLCMVGMHNAVADESCGPASGYVADCAKVEKADKCNKSFTGAGTSTSTGMFKCSWGAYGDRGCGTIGACKYEETKVTGVNQ